MEEGSGGVGDLGQTAGPELWALECCQPDLSSAAARASTALWDSRGRESHAAHWGNSVTMSCGSSHYPQIKETYQSFMITLDK